MLGDIRHNPSELDKRMLEYLTYTNRPFAIIATKIDKVAKSKISVYIKNIAQGLFITTNNIIPYSSETHFNRDKILEIIENDLKDDLT